MRIAIRFLAVGLAVVSVLACEGMSTGPDSSTAAKLSDLEKRLDNLEGEKSTLISELEAAKKELNSVRFDQQMKKLEERIVSVALLKPGEEGFGFVKTPIGTLTVSIQDIQPYANGTKVILTIGNPLMAELQDLEATIAWGQVDSKGLVDNESAKSKKVSFVDPVKAGSWYRASVVLDGTPPSELGFLRVEEIVVSSLVLKK